MSHLRLSISKYLILWSLTRCRSLCQSPTSSRRESFSENIIYLSHWTWINQPGVHLEASSLLSHCLHFLCAPFIGYTCGIQPVNPGSSLTPTQVHISDSILFSAWPNLLSFCSSCVWEQWVVSHVPHIDWAGSRLCYVDMYGHTPQTTPRCSSQIILYHHKMPCISNWKI